LGFGEIFFFGGGAGGGMVSIYEGISATSVMFCNFYLVKNHKIVKKSTTTKAREKTSTDLKSLNVLCVFD